MRKAQLHEFVTGLVASTWNGDNADVAESVLAERADNPAGFLASRVG